MPKDLLFWWAIYIMHGLIFVRLTLGQYKVLPIFTLLIAQDLLQTPVLLYFYQHYPQHYLFAYTAGKSLDIILTFLAMTEMFSKQYRVIGYTLEFYMAAELIVHYVIGQGYPHFWYRVEAGMKPIYLAFEIIWLIILRRGQTYVDNAHRANSQA